MVEPRHAVTGPLAERLGLGPHELIAVVGAGGKSTIVFGVAADLASGGARVIATTTTKVAPDQPAEPIVWSADPPAVEAALRPGVTVFVASARGEGKIVGIPPGAVDALHRETSADHVVVEADGARRMSIKAPADHEPVIPRSSTTVIVVASLEAVGMPISQAAHRPERVAALVGVEPGHVLTIDDVATVLLHPRGGLAGIPESSRVVVALTHASARTSAEAQRLVEALASHPGVDLAITMG